MGKFYRFVPFIILLWFISCSDTEEPAPDLCLQGPVLSLKSIIQPDSVLANGVIEIIASEGKGELQYSRNDTLYQPIGRFSRIKSGEYTIYVRDENNCIATMQVRVDAKPDLKIRKPGSGDSTSTDFEVVYRLLNWTPAEGGKRIHLYLDNTFKKAVYHNSTVKLNGLSEGFHQIRLILAENEDQELEIGDSIRIYTVDSVQVLTVQNGSGSGSYLWGDRIEISADPAHAHFNFNGWAGYINFVEEPLQPVTWIQIPNNDLSVEATYQEILYNLQVINGQGTGTFTFSSQVTISANQPVAGKAFDRWKGDVVYLENETIPDQSFIMPGADISLEALYKDLLYSLTVENGSGSGNYKLGEIIQVVADNPPAGQVFQSWTGDLDYLNNPGENSASVTMPAKAIKIIATYTSQGVITYILTVVNGTGDGAYEAGSKVTVTANPPSSGQVFKGWTGSIQYLEDPTAVSTVFTVPEVNATITASYSSTTINEISYVREIRPIFEAECTTSGCHASNTRYSDLTTYQGVKENAADIRFFVDIGRMPPNGRLPETQVKKIIDWIDQGAKNN
jgi:hypothetical protein